MSNTTISPPAFKSLSNEPERDYSTATKFDVDLIITARLMQFHDALVDRGQIKPIPQVSGPMVAEETAT